MRPCQGYSHRTIQFFSHCRKLLVLRRENGLLSPKPQVSNNQHTAHHWSTPMQNVGMWDTVGKITQQKMVSSCFFCEANRDNQVQVSNNVSYRRVDFDSRQVAGIFAGASRPALAHTKLSTQWLPGTLPPKKREADHSPPPSAKNKWSLTPTHHKSLRVVLQQSDNFSTLQYIQDVLAVLQLRTLNYYLQNFSVHTPRCYISRPSACH